MPEEILLLVLSYLNKKTLLSLQEVSEDFNRISNDRSLWNNYNDFIKEISYIFFNEGLDFIKKWVFFTELHLKIGSIIHDDILLLPYYKRKYLLKIFNIDFGVVYTKNNVKLYYEFGVPMFKFCAEYCCSIEDYDVSHICKSLNIIK